MASHPFRMSLLTRSRLGSALTHQCGRSASSVTATKAQRAETCGILREKSHFHTSCLFVRASEQVGRFAAYHGRFCVSHAPPAVRCAALRKAIGPTHQPAASAMRHPTGRRVASSFQRLCAAATIVRFTVTAVTKQPSSYPFRFWGYSRKRQGCTIVKTIRRLHRAARGDG